MELNFFGLIALLMVTITSVSLLITTDWRISTALLAIQYIGVFILVRMEWSLAMAAVKLVAGWISCTVLGMALLSLPQFRFRTEKQNVTRLENGGVNTPIRTRLPLGRPFILLTAILVLLTTFSLAGIAQNWFEGTSFPVLLGGFILIGMGLLQLGFSDRGFPVILGLLTTLSGFEILYAS
ncbi:MAG TPA: hypothetical protein VMV80_06775, partial [Anaerolineales bacterium]|nr:hypothetical protein [Anaerolineales bacterium]